MLTRLGDWNRLVRRFVLGVAGIEPLDPVIANALAQPAPQGLTAQLRGDGVRPMTRPKAAVVGSGVAGLTAAYLLQRRYDVTLFEADGRLGGHAHTHELPTVDGRAVDVDTGFIVHNRRTYPNLLRLFGELGVATQESDMSMSVRCAGCGLEYAGARGLGGLFPQASNLARPAYLRMLAEVRRFHRHARRVLGDEGDSDDQADDDTVTLGAFLAVGGYSRYFVEHFLLPVVASVWSAGETVSLALPGPLPVRVPATTTGCSPSRGSPRWRTVVGGSRRYVEARREGARRRSPCRRPCGRSRAPPSGVEIRDDADTAAPRRRGRGRHPPRPGARAARRADRRANARCWARSATRATSPSSTTTPRCCRAGPARGRRGTTSRPPAGSATRRCSSATT